MGFPSPGMAGRAISDALNPSQVEAAGERESAGTRLELDEKELRDLERAEYYAGDRATGHVAPVATTPQRGFLARLLDHIRGA